MMGQMVKVYIDNDDFTHCEAKEFSVARENGHMKRSILQIDSSVPVVQDEGRNDAGQRHHPELLSFLMKKFRSL